MSNGEDLQEKSMSFPCNWLAGCVHW